MKTFIKYDYYAQIFVAVSFIILLVTDLVTFEKGYYVIGYFVMATFHTVSFLIRIFLKNYPKSTYFKIYSTVSLTILISLLILFLANDSEWLPSFAGFILTLGIPLTPVLAICYLIIVHTDYEKFLTIND